MNELAHICRTLLDNADLDIVLGPNPDQVVLDFMVGGSGERVTFACGQVFAFHLVKDHDETDGFFVGKTVVARYDDRAAMLALITSEGWGVREQDLSSELYRVQVQGGVCVDIVCATFSWDVRPAADVSAV